MRIQMFREVNQFLNTKEYYKKIQNRDIDYIELNFLFDRSSDLVRRADNYYNIKTLLVIF